MHFFSNTIICVLESYKHQHITTIYWSSISHVIFVQFVRHWMYLLIKWNSSDCSFKWPQRLILPFCKKNRSKHICTFSDVLWFGNCEWMLTSWCFDGNLNSRLTHSWAVRKQFFNRIKSFFLINPNIHECMFNLFSPSSGVKCMWTHKWKQWGGVSFSFSRSAVEVIYKTKTVAFSTSKCVLQGYEICSLTWQMSSSTS